MPRHIDDELAENKQNMLVWCDRLGRSVPYKDLNWKEKDKFDNKYPYHGLTYEEYCGERS